MGEAIPEEMEQEIQQKLEEEFALARSEAEEMVAEQFVAEIDPLLQSVKTKLEDQGFNADRPAVHNAAVESLLDVLTGEADLEETVEISVAGRENKDISKEAAMSPTEDTPTKTIEVPIEGGDVEDPETVEKEVIDPDMSDAQLSKGMSAEEVARLNEYGEDDEDNGVKSRSDDVPEGGLPWYQ